MHIQYHNGVLGFCEVSSGSSLLLLLTLVLPLQVLDHYKDKVAHIAADKAADDVASQIASAMQ